MEYKLDYREVEDIQEQIKQYAGAYVPEWEFNRENPDAGSVIAITFAQQMAANIKRYNMALEQFHLALINLAGISLLPAQPSGSVVLFKLIDSTIPGVMIRENTKLYAYDNSNMIIFETEYPIYVTASSLTSVFMVSGTKGYVIPILGQFKPISLVPETIREKDVSINEIQPFSLFQFKGPGIEKNAMLLYHSYIFDVENEDIFLHFTGNSSFLRAYADGKFTLSYYSEKGLVPVEQAEIEEDTLKIRKYHKNKKIGSDKQYSLLVLSAREPITEGVEFNQIKISSAGNAKGMEFVSDGTTDMEPTRFQPFGNTLGLYAECFLGHDEYFSKAGARITLKFTLQLSTHQIRVEEALTADSLKIIKRKPRKRVQPPVAKAYADEITMAYYNGSGWKRLICEENYTTLLAAGDHCEILLHFICPQDWSTQNAFGYEGRLLKIQLLKADNCYMIPCIHYYPEIVDMSVAYTYGKFYHQPDKIEAIYGTRRENITRYMADHKKIPAFMPNDYRENALYLGFDRELEMGPVSLLFELKEDMNQSGTPLLFEYSAREGFKPLQIIDQTELMMKTGNIRFMPPSDMSRHLLEGKNCYWIRIVDQGNAYDEKIYHQAIRGIRINTVAVQNRETGREEVFYLDEVAAYGEFPLTAGHILDAAVWVNEKKDLSLPQMKQMLRDKPGEVNAEYDSSGNIQDFYVRWYETEEFGRAGSGERCYVLDRINNKILFGDGIHVKIPRVTDSIAFKVTTRSCNGKDGNVEKGTIEGVLSGQHFVDQVTNIIPACGGINLESLDHARKRGANIISSRKRLVTRYDYEREVRSVSDNVDKVTCMIADGVVRLVVLMKDFGGETHTFKRLLPDLNRHLTNQCELTIKRNNLHIMEPVSVEISVTVWVWLPEDESDFSFRENMKKELADYLSPISTKRGQGWDIGIIPRKAQVLMKLNAIRKKAVIRRLVIVGKYRDERGIHECELESLPENPFFVCQSGHHVIHVLTGEEKRRREF